MRTLIPINEAAAALNMSVRSVQLKCKKLGIVKIGNQYQITDDVLQNWLNSKNDVYETKYKTKQNNETISHPKQKKLRFDFTHYYIIFLFIVIAFIVYTMYIKLDAEIGVLKNDNKKVNKEYKEYIIMQQKRLNDAFDVIYNQSVEIENLKVKDSVRNGSLKL